MEHARLTGAIDRVISVGLSEREWQAFLAVAPQPVAWLQARIREAIEVDVVSTSPSAAANTTSATRR